MEMPIWLDRAVAGWIAFIAVSDVHRQSRIARQTGEILPLGLSIVFGAIWFYAGFRLWG